MKKVLCAVMFVALFSFFAMAQKAPLASANADHHARVAHSVDFVRPGSPTLCGGRCPFYGGDIDLNDPNANAFANANTTLVPLTYTYSALTPPFNVMVTGMVINNSPTVSGGVQYDPVTGIYDIRTGVSSGNGGTSLCNSGAGPCGTAALHEDLTGRNPFGFTEESVGSIFTSPIPLTGGTTYWLNYLPQCTATDCDANIYYFESNTDGLNGVNAALQTPYQAFFNSAFFGVNWENWCAYLGSGNTTECQGMSYALAGRR